MKSGRHRASSFNLHMDVTDEHYMHTLVPRVSVLSAQRSERHFPTFLFVLNERPFHAKSWSGSIFQASIIPNHCNLPNISSSAITVLTLYSGIRSHLFSMVCNMVALGKCSTNTFSLWARLRWLSDKSWITMFLLLLKMLFRILSAVMKDNCYSFVSRFFGRFVSKLFSALRNSEILKQ